MKRILYFVTTSAILMILVATSCDPRQETIGPISPAISEGRLDSIPYNPKS